MATYSGAELQALVRMQKSILNWGPPFTGKTQSLITLVKYLIKNKLGKLYHVDLDTKCESLVAAAAEAGPEILAHIEVIRPLAIDVLKSSARSISNEEALFEAVRAVINSFVAEIDPATGKWKEGSRKAGAYIMDSMTEWSDIVMQFVVAKVGMDVGAKDFDARNYYFKQGNKFMEAIKIIKKFPCITGWMAHDSIENDEQHKAKRTVVPNVTGRKLPFALAKEFTTVVYSYRVQDGTQPPKFLWRLCSGENDQGEFIRTAGVLGMKNPPQFMEQDYTKIWKD